jgi:hypothetical protein
LAKLRQRLEVAGFYFYPEYSGKVALYKLSLVLKKKTPDQATALIPDYICNVVNLALEKAGYEICTYRTDDRFEADVEEIKGLIEEKESIGVFLTANIFGSSALLDALETNDLRGMLVDRDIHVVIDLCQDISLIRALPRKFGDNLSCIVSFNDKSFLGVAGGGILTPLVMRETTEPMSRVHRRFLYRWLLIKIFQHGITPKLTKVLQKLTGALPSLSHLPPNRKRASFEYGYCGSFPWNFELVAVAKIQIILALIGLVNLRHFHAKKIKFITSYRPYIKMMRYTLTSPYVILLADGEVLAQMGRRIKPSYAVHHKPEYSIRADLIIVHNKGFFDDV